MLAQELALLRHAEYFDLSSKQGRKRSAQLLGDLFLRLVMAAKPDLALEVGAYDAKFSRKLRETMPAIPIVAFEANMYNFDEMRKKFDFQKLDIEYLHLAASNQNGPVTFQVQVSKRGQTLTRVAGDNSLLARIDPTIEYENLSTTAVRIDQFLKQRKFTGKFAAWIDVEGAAELVLGGLGDVITDCIAILIEVEEEAKWQGQWTRLDVSTFLTASGFVPVARDFEWSTQFNVVYLRNSILDVAAVRENLIRYFSRLANEARERSAEGARSSQLD